jgi:hypothetical protein
MKYMAPVEPRHAVSTWANNLDVDDLGGIQIIELAGAEHGLVRNGSRRWLGVVIAVAAAVTGFGFVSHGSEAALLGAAPARPAVAVVASAGPERRVGSIATDPASQTPDARPIVVVAPADGAKVTSGVVMTGGVVTVDAAADRVLGTVRASVSMGELVLGERVIDVQAVGPFKVRIPVFPPPFDAPVTLRLQASTPGSGAGFDVARGFRLAIPSAVGFWQATPTGTVDAKGRVQLQIRGYAPLSARSIDIAIRDPRGHDVAAASVRIAFDADLPGAAAGRILGLGTFDATVWLPRASVGQHSLCGTWRDAATGARLHVDTALEPSVGP